MRPRILLQRKPDDAAAVPWRNLLNRNREQEQQDVRLLPGRTVVAGRCHVLSGLPGSHLRDAAELWLPAVPRWIHFHRIWLHNVRARPVRLERDWGLRSLQRRFQLPVAYSRPRKSLRSRNLFGPWRWLLPRVPSRFCVPGNKWRVHKHHCPQQIRLRPRHILVRKPDQLHAVPANVPMS
jgi:hypothetical protein